MHMKGMRELKVKLERKITLVIAANQLKNYLSIKGFEGNRRIDAIINLYGMFACNDRKDSDKEFDAFKKLFGEVTYDQFFQVMVITN